MVAAGKILTHLMHGDNLKKLGETTNPEFGGRRGAPVDAGAYYEGLSATRSQNKVTLENGENHEVYYDRVIQTSKFKLHIQLLKAFKAQEKLVVKTGAKPSVKKLTDDLADFTAWQTAFDAVVKSWDCQPNGPWETDETTFRRVWLEKAKQAGDAAEAKVVKSRRRR